MSKYVFILTLLTGLITLFHLSNFNAAAFDIKSIPTATW